MAVPGLYTDSFFSKEVTPAPLQYSLFSFFLSVSVQADIVRGNPPSALAGGSFFFSVRVARFAYNVQRLFEHGRSFSRGKASNTLPLPAEFSASVQGSGYLFFEFLALK